MLPKFKSEFNEIDGVYQFAIDTPFDVKFVCIYYFEIDDKKVFYDAGLNMRNWEKLFFSALQDKNISIKDIDYCIISHHHLDHTGLIKKFKRRNPNIQIVMGEFTNSTMKWETERENSEELENEAKKIAKEMIKFGISEAQGKRLIQWHTMWPKLRRYHEPDKIVRDGEEICFKTNKLKIIWTPGHSVGHICVFEENNRYLFSGDHILSRITPHIGNFLVNPKLQKKYDFENILDYYLKSLDRIDALNAKIIFPAHQEVIYNPHERILEIKEHHKNRLNEISSLIENNSMTPFKISQIHFGEDLDEINSFLALSEVLAHLIYLESQDRVKRIEKNGKFFFSS
ncbi:MAG: MBL fold metallo-hydrolase [Promethearchaeota archaeon]|nr:MAG: MBL fold metallo-hydrolase [Candidatus Lokiarchaeota archaeon]